MVEFLCDVTEFIFGIEKLVFGWLNFRFSFYVCERVFFFFGCDVAR